MYTLNGDKYESVHDLILAFEKYIWDNEEEMQERMDREYEELDEPIVIYGCTHFPIELLKAVNETKYRCVFLDWADYQMKEIEYEAMRMKPADQISRCGLIITMTGQEERIWNCSEDYVDYEKGCPSCPAVRFCDCFKKYQEEA